MPAWGKSMSDEYVWNMAAFLQELPKLDADRYKEMVAHSSGHHHDHGGDHDDDADHDSHEHGSEAGHDDPENGDGKAESAQAAASAASPGHAHEAEANKSAGTMHTHADGTQHMHSATRAKK